VTVSVTLMMVVPVAGLVPVTTMVPVYAVGLGSKELSTVGTTDTFRLNVPELGVVPEVGETASQPWLLPATAVKAADDPPPDTLMVAVGILPPTR